VLNKHERGCRYFHRSQFVHLGSVSVSKLKLRHYHIPQLAFFPGAFIIGGFAGRLAANRCGLPDHTYQGVRTDRARADEETAEYAVAAMLPTHPVKDSRELRQRIDKYLDALRRTKKDNRGIPVIRQDGSISVDWSVNITEQLGKNSDRLR
jgi:hypothetical protein